MTAQDSRDFYFASDVVRGFHWLGHESGVTEVCVLHPEYRPGDRDWNRAHESWPRTYYVDHQRDLLRLVEQYAGRRMVCYGLNPRPDVLRTVRNGVLRLRSATEADIAVSQTLLLDIDVHGGLTPSREERLSEFTTQQSYWHGLGINPPVVALTGRGAHLLFAYPAVRVAEHPDIKERLRHFKESFRKEHQAEIDRLEAKVDNTQDLRRMVRVYGTAKPTVGIISQFYGLQRQPDPALRDHLLGLQITPKQPYELTKTLTINDRLPEWFSTMRHAHPDLDDLWEGTGKPPGTDQSTSGYDFSIACFLINIGLQDNDAIATIIANRPNGQEERAKKGPAYLRRTITVARQRQQRKR